MTRLKRRAHLVGWASLFVALGAGAQSGAAPASEVTSASNLGGITQPQVAEMQVAQTRVSEVQAGGGAVQVAQATGGGQDTSVVGEESAAEVKLSPAELRVQGQQALASIESSSKTVKTMATSARDKRDVVKLLCLEDKTSQVGAALETAQERIQALTAALDTSALERARHEYVMLMTLEERVATLMNEANQCIGEETGFSGDAELSVEIDPNLPEVQADIVGFVAVVAIPPSLSSAVY